MRNEEVVGVEMMEEAEVRLVVDPEEEVAVGETRAEVLLEEVAVVAEPHWLGKVGLDGLIPGRFRPRYCRQRR